MFQNQRQRKTSLNERQISQKKKSVKDIIELSFIGTPRSGTDTIAIWILRNFKGFAFYRADPFTSLPKPKDVSNIESKSNLVVRNKSDVFCLAYNFQTLTPKELKTITNPIFILRNPYHQLASMIAWKKNYHNESMNVKEYLTFRELWIAHAKNFLSKRLYEDSKMYILFDRWATEEKYRQKILQQLGKTFTNNSTLTKKPITKSPFSDLGVCDRFEKMQDELPLKALCCDTKIHRLWTQILPKK